METLFRKGDSPKKSVASFFYIETKNNATQNSSTLRSAYCMPLLLPNSPAVRILLRPSQTEIKVLGPRKSGSCKLLDASHAKLRPLGVGSEMKLSWPAAGAAHPWQDEPSAAAIGHQQPSSFMVYRRPKRTRHKGCHFCMSRQVSELGNFFGERFYSFQPFACVPNLNLGIAWTNPQSSPAKLA